MVSASQIRDKILEFLTDAVSLDEFEDWIVQRTWNVHLSGSVAAEELTFAVEEALSEYSSAMIGRGGLIRRLSELEHNENHPVSVVTGTLLPPALKSWGLSPALKAYARS